MTSFTRTAIQFSLFFLVSATTLSPSAMADDKRTPGTKPGDTAPEFTLSNLDGKKVSLSQFRGATVILEWFNPDCPFVKEAHTNGVLRTTGNRATKDGHVWLAINSSGKGRQGHGLEVNRRGVKTYTMKYPVLLDEDGAVGHLYGATRTPEIVVINSKGVISYRGAVDNTGSGDPSDAEGGVVRNYVTEAIDALSGKKVKGLAKSVEPYGCTIKYAR
jgi:peroxiredoxin